MLHSKVSFSFVAPLLITITLFCLLVVGLVAHRVDASSIFSQDAPRANPAFSTATTSEFTPTHWVYLPLTARGQAAPTFGYGVQVNTAGDASANIGHIRTLGFDWMKIQVRWKDIEPNQGDFRWDRLDPVVSAYHAGGVKVLLSVVHAPDWARPPNDNRSVEGPPADYATLANFLRELCQRYKGQVLAVEVWNEQNLFYEGGGRPIPPANYVAMLSASYQAIKLVDPNILVISGAPTPTGINDGNIAIDDVVYLQQMYAAGLKGKCDAIGAHPPGYNNPPDAQLGYTDPAEPCCKSHRAFFFRETLEAYRNVMVSNGDAAGKIWATEFGWASATNPEPGYEYAQNNTLDEQAQYTVRAYQMAKAWGWVGAMFLWNLDFGVTNPNTVLAYWSLLRPDPVPAYAALVAMPK